MRFRKSINLGGVRVNISKKDIGASIGCKGLRTGIGADGKRRTTVSIPKTGISHTFVSKKPSYKKNKQINENKINQKYNQDNLKTWQIFAPLYKFLGIILIFLSSLLCLVEPIAFLGILFGIFNVYIGKKYTIKKEKTNDINQ